MNWCDYYGPAQIETQQQSSDRKDCPHLESMQIPHTATVESSDRLFSKGALRKQDGGTDGGTKYSEHKKAP